MKSKITKRLVDRICPGSRDTFVWDTELPGYGLKVTPSGKRIYVLQYRLGTRKAPWRYTIGLHGEHTPDSARKEATRMRGLIAKGVNPALERAATKNSILVSDLSTAFLEEHVKSRRKARTVVEYERLVDRIINPKLGNLAVADVNRAQIARLHHSLHGTPTQANRVLAVLSKMFNWAELKGYRCDNTNPCRHVEKNRESRRDRFLSESELAALAKALAKANADHMTSPQAISAIRMLLFTGARLTEILSLEWAHVDFESVCLRLPDSKTGAKVIHLSPPALQILRAQHEIEGCPYVFPGQRSGQHLVNLGKPWRKIRKLAGLDNVRLHDLRHSYASFGASAGLGLPMIGALLGHTQAQTTARYAHLATDPLKQANDLIGRRIAAAMNLDETNNSNIAELPAPKSRRGV